MHVQRLLHHASHAVQQPQGGGVPAHVDLVCLHPQQGPGPGKAALLVPDQLHHSRGQCPASRASTGLAFSADMSVLGMELCRA